MSDVREAAERLRWFNDNRHEQWSLGGWRTDYISCLSACAEAYLASHPPDDETDLDENWLRTLLPVEPGRGVCLTNRLSLFNTKRGWSLYAIIDEPDDDRWGEYPIGTLKTRGDVRRLCAALGITLKESEASE